jgi:CYTH domain-containing protein
MSIENERKFILRQDFNAEVLQGWDIEDIETAHLGEGARVRCINGQLYFTYKRWITRQNRLREFEPPVPRDVYEDYASEASEITRKIRYSTKIDDEKWSVDFMRDARGQIFFVLAEVEMPEGRDMPNTMPIQIAGHIIHLVDRKDARFSDRRLADVTLARQLYAELLPAA